MKKNTILAGFVGAGVLGMAGSALAQECITTSPPGRIPAAELVVLNQDATGISRFCGGTAGYTSDAYFDAAGGDIYLGTGNSGMEGDEYDLGALVAGNELIFYIYVRNENRTYYTGPGERNPDGIVHAAVTNLGQIGTSADGQPITRFHIGFEDLFNGGDLDYDDINLVIETTGIAIVDNDTDDDGIDDPDDNCPLNANANQLDTDGDEQGDVCDACPNDAGTDPDSDGVCTSDDNCPANQNADQADADADGRGDACDNCPAAANADQADADGDAAGDACDTCPNDASDDEDADGVCGDIDVCAGTELSESVPTERLGVNRFALVDGDGNFDTVSPKGRGPQRSYTIQDTHGCACSQIIEALDLGEGHTKFGCSISAMDDWTAQF